MRLWILSLLFCSVFNVAVSLCGDNICDYMTETCFSCSSDCSCSFDGLRFDSWSCGPSSLSSCPQSMSSSSVVLPEVFNFLPNVNGPVTGRLSGYLKVEDLTHITLIIDGANVGARVNVDGSLVINSFLVQPLMNNTIEISLSDDRLHFVILEFFSLSNVTQRNVRMLWKKEQQHIHHGLNSYGTSEVITDFYYSVNTCGDRIVDPQETNSSSRFHCSKETSKVALGSSLSTCSAGVCLPTSQCGNGVCMELFVDDCFTDCYSYITKTCNAVAVKPGLISDLSTTDTLGDLIKNQMLMHLPGIEHMASGVNIITGEESQAPLFYQSYCNADDISTIQDSYRGMVYTVPDGLYAIPSPKCVFSASSTIYESTIDMANSYANSYAYDVGINGDLTVDTLLWGKYSLSAAYSSSREKSVNTARSLRTKRSGSIVVSDVVCETSKVQQSTMSLHPIFLEDLASVTNTSDIIPLMRKYGTHYYKSATMGGRLRQVTVLDKQYQSSKSSRDIEESAKMSVSASIGGSAYGATASISGSYASSKDSSVSVEQQSEYESSSSRSTIITYGGPPGSFGPTTSNAPSNFGDWASAVDLLPVPIDYQLLPIYTAINAKWVTQTGKSIRQLWYDAQKEFRDSFSETTEVHSGYKFTLYWYPSYGGAGVKAPYTQFPQMDVRYTLQFDGASYPVMDNNGPPGTYAPVAGHAKDGRYPFPITFEFYHPNATWGNSVPFLKASGTNADFAWGVSDDPTFLIFHNWNNNAMVCFGFALPGPWYREQIASWNTRLRLQFEILSGNGATLPSGNGIGHSMEFSFKGDTPSRSFTYVVDFTNSFPAAGKSRTYFIDIPISTTSPNRITTVKKVGLQYGTRGIKVTNPSTFFVSKMWTALNLSVQNSSAEVTVFSMGDGQLELSNLDKEPQWAEMSLLSELFQ